MSVRVELDGIRDAIAEQGSTPYLVTVGDDGRPRVNSVAPSWEDDRLVVPAGRHGLANVAARPGVTLLWPPREPGGYSLLVDGEGRVEGEQVAVTPTSAILHRSAVGGGNDCAPVG
jgi:hypothetical protein